LAPDQRGYSPGARPPGRRSYTLDRLDADVLALADAAGAERFDLLGHDWGAAVAWDLAARRPDRVRSLTALSTPHPAAFREALLRGQLLRSWYMLLFQLPALPELLIGAGGAAALEKGGLDALSARRYAERFSPRGALTGPLNWYRAMPFGLRDPTPDVSVPVLYVWSTGDRYLGRPAAEATARHVRGPYRFEVLEGVSHWLPETAAARLAPLIVDHLGAVPV
jgi:pimeloyl-ACP methyl ester carboxylesterase